jgi:hypothetical protein
LSAKRQILISDSGILNRGDERLKLADVMQAEHISLLFPEQKLPTFCFRALASADHQSLNKAVLEKVQKAPFSYSDSLP